MAIQIESPFDMFNGLDGKPLSNGKVYIGQVGTDPTVIANQIPVFWDEAMTIPAAQPLTTNAGYIVRSGAPSRVYTATDYSMSVRNASNILVYYIAQFGAIDYASEADLSALSGALQLADYDALRAYTGTRNAVYVASAGIAGEFLRVATGTDNGGTIIVASNGIIWSRVYSGPVDVRWWGAKFDNVADDSAAHQACINYAQPLQKQIIWPVGTSKITAQLQVAFSLFGLNILGQGYAKTRLNYAAISPAAASAIFIIGHSGALCGAVIEGIGFDGNATSTGIVIAGQDGQIVRNCQFGLNAFGGVFRNSAAGSFTEYCVFENCSFLRNCASALWYNVVGSGDVSFHGSGLFRCQVETPETPAYRSVVVDPSAFPYNAPMDVQVWSNAAGVFIDAATRTIDATPYFLGNITTEAFVGPLVLANSPVGREIPLRGGVGGNTAAFEMGSLFLVEAVITNASGTRQTVGGRVSKQQALTTGANAVVGIPLCIMNGAVNYTVNINGPNYNYRMLVSAFSKENSGLAPVLATFATFNSAGWGAPTFSIDPTTSALVITNAAYPASGVTATIEAEQIGQSIYDPFFK